MERSNTINTTTQAKKPIQLENETHEFNADIQQLMGLIVNSFYSSADIFLRELVSNSSDALDKIRYQSLTDVNILGDSKNLEIRITVNKEAKTISIEDTGVGMTNEDLKNTLGTIARSGTKNFMKALSDGADVNMIGQFGVGFYSAFLVADRVVVTTKHNDGDIQVWESYAGNKYSISKGTEGDIIRGTRIDLYVKDGSEKYLEENTIKDIIKTHSEFISYPIKILATKTREVPVEQVVDESKPEEKLEGDETVPEKVEEKLEGDEKVEAKSVIAAAPPKTRMETYTEWETVNNQKPIWTRPESELELVDYNQFYKNMEGNYDDPLAHKHFSVEGSVSIKGLIYVPKRAPFGMFQQEEKQKCNIKLYVKRVFITDNFRELMPGYLDFIKGVVDTEDLELNVSREILQQNKMLKMIRKTLVKKSIELLEDVQKDSDAYDEFYQSFSKNIKLGVYEDAKYRNRLAKLLQFSSSKDGKLRTLDQYISDMGENQPGIYYITGQSKDMVSNSPFVEKLTKKGWEVLYLVEPIDEYMLQNLKDYDDKPLLCVTKSDIDFGDTDEEKTKTSELTEKYKGLCDKILEILGESIEKVIVSNRITNSPCCLVTGSNGMSANMERIMKAQAMATQNPMQFMMNKKTFEINPDNKIIQAIYGKFTKDSDGIKDMVWLLYDTSILDSGFSLEKPSEFTGRIHRIMSLGLGADDDEEDDVEIDFPEDEDLQVNDGEEDGDMETID